MEFRNQDISMGIPSSFRQNPEIKRSSMGEDPRRGIHGDDVVSSPSPPDRNHIHSYRQQQQYTTTISRSRRDPDPNEMASQPDPGSAITPTTTTTAATVAVIRYRECQKNHAAHMGSHVVDGCGEFMPTGDQGTPESMRCAACDCHRNFHRKESSSSGSGGGGSSNRYHTATPPAIFQPVPFQQAPAIHGHGISRHPSGTMMMAFGGGGGVHAESSSEDLNLQGSHSSRKRFRTKFTQEQKEKMMGLAEKIGWRIQKQDEDEVQRFCAESGVKRQVFKVWMHNNRQAIKRKQHSN